MRGNGFEWVSKTFDKRENIAIGIKNNCALQSETGFCNCFKSITFILLIISFSLAILVGCGYSQSISQVIATNPSMPSSATNNGSGEVNVSWNISYTHYNVTTYDFIIFDPNNAQVLRVPYPVGDKKGEHSPIKDNYVWKVPENQPEGVYRAELDISTIENAGAIGGFFWPFRIASHVGTLRISKFEDLNGNGLREDNENGLKGWKFNITDPYGRNYTRYTDEQGQITLQDVPVGLYKIDEGKQPGYRNTKKTLDVKVTENSEISAEFGNQPISTLTIVKFNDTNRNGIQESSEQGLEGWNFSVHGPVSFTATTDPRGMMVREVLPGSYQITETPKPGEGWNASTQTEQSITLVTGQNGIKKFGNYHIPHTKLIITKFEDKNGNGQRDADEAVIPGWEFVMSGPMSFTEKTGQDGTIVQDVKPGYYTIRESSRQGWTSTTGAEKSISLSPGDLKQVDFGNKVNRLLINVFSDTNLNRVRDKEEEGLPDWTSAIEGANGSSETVGPTNSDGIIAVEGLAPGKYNIMENLKNGWINTTPTNQLISIDAGEDKEVDFGNINSSSIEIFKFNDTNRNGKLDVGENGVSGLVFNISGPHGFVKTTEPTDANGITIIKGLYPGNYTITENQRNRWISTTPSSQYVSLHIGDYQRVSFGNYYCQACYRIHDNPKLNSSYNQDIRVIKTVSSISAGDMNATTGSVVNYNIQLCPAGGFENIGSTPTDIVIAVDNSPSINSLSNSTISATQELVKGIEEKDKLNVTRVGLVSWSDINNSKIEIPLTNKYDTIISAAQKIKFAEGKETDFQEGLDLAQNAIQEASQSTGTGRTKKIVFITDANDDGYHGPTRYPSSDYTIYAIVVGDMKETNTSYKVLSNLTKDYRGYLASIMNPSDIERVLTEMATAGPMLKNVRLVETLPNYLILINNTSTDDNGKIRLNGDSKDWTTTTIEWDIGDLSGCWNTDFQVVFCWKLPADVNQPKLASYVNYTDDKGVSRSITLPEYEINIVHSVEQAPHSTPIKGATVKQPGFEALFAAIGLTSAIYLYRRMNSKM